jgi:hypothetical protein
MEEPNTFRPALVIASHGMEDLGPQARRENLKENLEIARQCQQAAVEIADTYPIAARILQHEARHWRGS